MSNDTNTRATLDNTLDAFVRCANERRRLRAFVEAFDRYQLGDATRAELDAARAEVNRDRNAAPSLFGLVEQYTATLPDDDWDEFYMSSREFARRELDKFAAWLMETPKEAP